MKKTAVPAVNGLCGLFPAIEALADVYLPVVELGSPSRSRFGPIAPWSLHNAHNRKFSLLVSSAQPVAPGPKSVNLPALPTLRMLAELVPNVPEVTPDAKVN